MEFEVTEIQNNGGIQSIHIPENFKIDDQKVYIKKIGNSLYIIPFQQSWQTMLNSLEQFSDDFMEDRNQPLQQNRKLVEK